MPDPAVSALMNELAVIVINARATRNDVVPLYADLIEISDRGHEVPWGDINRTIIHRWSASGLEEIKRRAWAWQAAPLEIGTGPDAICEVPDA